MSGLAWLAVAVVAGLTGHTAVNAVLLRRPPRRPPPVRVPVAVLLPVRDEAHQVADCLAGLLAQRAVADLSVVVLDDGSTDGTADVVRTTAGDRVTLRAGAPLPAGWLGKPHACQQLAELVPDRVQILVFVDADVRLAPDAIAATVALLDGFDLVSPYPRLIARTVGERLVQPLLAWSWLTFLPLRAVERSARPALAAAGGQLLAVRRGAYRRAGGHAAVRDRVLEDIELARAVKRTGGRIALAAGARLADCRMYTSWAQLRAGYTKSLWASLGSLAGSLAVLGLLGFGYLVPLLVLPWAPWAGLTGYLLGVAGRVISGRAAGSRVWPDALAHPVSVLLFGYLLLASHAAHRRGTLTWKGRPL